MTTHHMYRCIIYVCNDMSAGVFPGSYTDVYYRLNNVGQEAFEKLSYRTIDTMMPGVATACKVRHVVELASALTVVKCLLRHMAGKCPLTSIN